MFEWMYVLHCPPLSLISPEEIALLLWTGSKLVKPYIMPRAVYIISSLLHAFMWDTIFWCEEIMQLCSQRYIRTSFMIPSQEIQIQWRMFCIIRSLWSDEKTHYTEKCRYCVECVLTRLLFRCPTASLGATQLEKVTVADPRGRHVAMPPIIRDFFSLKYACLCLLDLYAAFDTIESTIPITRFSSWSYGFMALF